MRKILSIFLIMMSFSLIIAGAVSADPIVDVEVEDANGDPAVVTNPGDEVNVLVLAQANDTIVYGPYVNITVDPETGLLLDANNAAMTTDGINWILNTDPAFGGFLLWSNFNQEWEWFWAGILIPGDEALLIIPSQVTDTGEITVLADLMGSNEQRQEVIEASDSYTFLSVPVRHPPCTGDRIPMQPTGSSLLVAMLGLASVIGGAVYGKLK